MKRRFGILALRLTGELEYWLLNVESEWNMYLLPAVRRIGILDPECTGGSKNWLPGKQEDWNTGSQVNRRIGILAPR